MSLRSLLGKRGRLVGEADQALLDQMAKVERELLAAVRETLQRYTVRGRLQMDGSETELFRELNKSMDRILKNSNYIDAVQRFLPNFDEVEKRALEFYKEAIPPNLKSLPLSAERKFLIEEITRSLLSAQSITTNITRPIQKILFRNITFGSDLRAAEDQLRKFIQGEPGKRGYLTRYVGQIAKDTISQYDGLINQKIADTYKEDLDGFVYAGALVDASRDNCIELVTGTGAFSDLAIEPGLYRVADIPQIIQRAEGRPGWIPGTNASNFFQNRGGYNCNHQVIPVVLSSEQASTLAAI